jgi:hypothetical protein
MGLELLLKTRGYEGKHRGSSIHHHSLLQRWAFLGGDNRKRIESALPSRRDNCHWMTLSDDSRAVIEAFGSMGARRFWSKPQGEWSEL